MSTYRISKFRHAAANTSLALACALFWQASTAQIASTPSAASAANPSAKVPAVEYRSVFKETSLGVEKDSDNWRKANDEVGKFTRGHVGILKWEEQEAAKAMKAPADKPAAQPATPKAAMPAPASSLPASPSTTKPIAAPAHKH
jgi:hypothetical protein